MKSGERDARKRVPKERISITNEERNRLLELGDAMGSGVLKLIAIAHPRSHQRWQKSQGKPLTKKIGRKGTPKSLREIVVRIAKETGWGYGRIVGKLKNLRIQ